MDVNWTAIGLALFSVFVSLIAYVFKVQIGSLKRSIDSAEDARKESNKTMRDKVDLIEREQRLQLEKMRSIELDFAREYPALIERSVDNAMRPVIAVMNSIQATQQALSGRIDQLIGPSKK